MSRALVLVLALLAGAALGAGEADRLMAKGEFERALALLNAQLAKRPAPPAAAEMHLRRAQCFFALQQSAKAKDAFKSALKLNPEVSLDPALANPLLVQLLADARASMQGTVAVQTDLKDAEVRLDGRPVGPAPLKLAVPLGRHRVELLTPDGAVRTREVVARSGETVRVALDAKVTPDVPATSSPPLPVDTPPVPAEPPPVAEPLDSARGERGDSARGERGDSARGERGDSARGERGDSARGERGDSARGERAEARDAARREAPPPAAAMEVSGPQPRSKVAPVALISGGALLLAGGAVGVVYSVGVKQSFTQQQEPGAPLTVTRAQGKLAQTLFPVSVGLAIAGAVSATVGIVLATRPDPAELSLAPLPGGGLVAQLGGRF